MSKTRTLPPGEDVFDLPDDDRVSLSNLDSNRARSFDAVGIDDYTATDKVLRANGDRFFVAKFR